MRQRVVTLTLLLLATLFCGMLHLVGYGVEDVVDRRRALGIARMATGLVVIWIWIGGAVMYHWRAEIRARVQAVGHAAVSTIASTGSSTAVAYCVRYSTA